MIGADVESLNMSTFFTPSRRDLEINEDFNGILIHPKKFYRFSEITLVLVPDCIGEEDDTMSSFKLDHENRYSLYDYLLPEHGEQSSEMFKNYRNDKPDLNSDIQQPTPSFDSRNENNYCSFRHRSTTNSDIMRSTSLVKLGYRHSAKHNIKKICDEKFVKCTAKKIYKIVIQSKGIKDFNEFIKRVQQLISNIDAIRDEFKLPFKYLCSLEGYYARSIVDILNKKVLICSFRKLCKVELISIQRIFHRIAYIFEGHARKSHVKSYLFNNIEQATLSTNALSPSESSFDRKDNTAAIFIPAVKSSSQMASTPTKCQSFPLGKSDIYLYDLIQETFHCYINVPWTNCFNVGEFVGAGNFSTVYKIYSKEDERNIFALKFIENRIIHNNYETIKKELKIIKTLKSLEDAHKNHIVEIFDVYWDTNKGLGIILEYADMGDLYNYLTEILENEIEPSNQPILSPCLGETFCANIIRQILLATHFLHSNNILHRDLKLENVLLFRSSISTIPIAKISDFGLSLLIDPTEIGAAGKNQIISGVCGTPYYIAPEMLLGKKYGFPIDIWAIGIMLFTMLTGCPPFYSTKDDQNEIFQCIIEGYINFNSDYASTMSIQASVFICCLLRDDPNTRLSAGDALQSKWLKENS